MIGGMFTTSSQETHWPHENNLHESCLLSRFEFDQTMLPGEKAALYVNYIKSCQVRSDDDLRKKNGFKFYIRQFLQTFLKNYNGRIRWIILQVLLCSIDSRFFTPWPSGTSKSFTHKGVSDNYLRNYKVRYLDFFFFLLQLKTHGIKDFEKFGTVVWRKPYILRQITLFKQRFLGSR